MEPHSHKGIDTPQIDGEDLIGKGIYNEDLRASAGGPTILQRGPYTLASGVKFITFPYKYGATTNLQVFLTPTGTAAPSVYPYVNGAVTSGFTVSGSGSETGSWISVGYK